MTNTYIVFQDNLKGLTEMPSLGGTTLENTIQNITEGCVGCRSPSQLYMYFIYRLHSEKVPLYGTRFDVYEYVKAVAGKNTEPIYASNKRGLDYAITHQTSMCWLFSDKLFD